MGSALAYAIASAGSDAVTLAPSFTVGGETPYFGSRTVFTLFFAPAAIAFDLPCLPISHSSLKLRSNAHSITNSCTSGKSILISRQRSSWKLTS